MKVSMSTMLGTGSFVSVTKLPAGLKVLSNNMLAVGQERSPAHAMEALPSGPALTPHTPWGPQIEKYSYQPYTPCSQSYGLGTACDCTCG